MENCNGKIFVRKNFDLKRSFNTFRVKNGNLIKTASTKREYYKWQIYYWEFMRRDPKYIEYYRKIASIKENNLQTSEEYKTLLEKYHNKFDVPDGYILDPEIAFEDLFKKYPSLFDVGMPIFGKSSIKLTPLRFKEFLNDGHLQIEINFKRVNSIDNLKAEITEIVDDYFGAYRSKNQDKGTVKMIDYDVILMAGDLKEKEFSNKKIAKKLYPRDFKQSANGNDRIDSAIRKAGQMCTRFEKMINGGYKNLIYP